MPAQCFVKLTGSVGLALLLLGCGPMMSAPPSTAMGAGSNGESGHGAAVMVRLDGEHPPQTLGGYQYHIRRRIGDDPRNEVGGVAQLGVPGFGAGGYFRRAIVATDRTQLSGQIAGGFLWGQLAIPLAVKTGEKTWLTTQPAAQWQMAQTVRLPIGVSRQLKDQRMFHAEAGVSFFSFRWDKEVYLRPLPLERKYIAPFVTITYSRGGQRGPLK